ncbi:MAG: hypothetical protein IKJ69_03070 [Clostridia bacterium]|nr:hypothetical protein [Clostridia bacterium]
MSNKKKKAAAGKSVAAKTNSGHKKPEQVKKDKEKQKAQAEKQAQRVREERQRAERERAKKSEDIQKRREKQRIKNEKIEKKAESREKHRSAVIGFAQSVKNLGKRLAEKIRYYTSKEFLGSFRYSRIFIFIVLPLVLIITGIVLVLQTPFVNVPSEIRSLTYSGRVESSLTAKPSAFSQSQQAMFIDSVRAHGPGDFDFYINTSITLDDNAETTTLRFGNPRGNGCILVATVYDDDGRILYRSLGLEEGKEINTARFFEEIEYGTHDVKVAVNAYDAETNEKIATKYARIKLSVGV